MFFPIKNKADILNNISSNFHWSKASWLCSVILFFFFTLLVNACNDSFISFKDSQCDIKHVAPNVVNQSSFIPTHNAISNFL